MTVHASRRILVGSLRHLQRPRVTASRPTLASSLPHSPRSVHTINETPGSRPKRAFQTGALLVGTSLFSLLAVFVRESSNQEKETVEKAAASDDTREPLSLPRYRLSEVRQHNATSPEPWVVYEDKVYNITDWVSAHPGGDVILRAAGQSIDPYWAIFSIHKQAHVRDILDGYLIGFVNIGDLVNGQPPKDAIQDPFEEDPARDPRLTRHTAKPCNAEPPNQELDEDFLTPNELFYVRNHMWVPVVEGEAIGRHTLTIELPDGEERTYTLQELRNRFSTHRVTAALQCSGNRRSDMTRNADKTNGLQWGVGAISNAEWEGVRLMDVLADAGLKVANVAAHTQVTHESESQGACGLTATDPNTHHVQFTGLEAYGASIPLATVVDPRNDVLLAFGMNGVPLPRDHGFPLRVVVPGHVAARSVKWLSKIVISDEESTSQWQRRDYKSFGPNERSPDWDKAPSIQEMPITSAITKILVGECVRECTAAWLGQKLLAQEQQQQNPKVGDENELGQEQQPIALQGYAVSGGGRDIARVDISLNGGKTWDQADLVDEASSLSPSSRQGGNKSWAWRRWRYLGSLSLTPSESRKCVEVVVKATDTSYNSQPQDHASIYNVRGNLANAWHRVKLCPHCIVTPSGSSDTDAHREKGKGEEARPVAIWRTGQAFGCGFGQESG